MIGDRLDTDMLLANTAGVDGCLVFTGVTSSEEEMRRLMSIDSRVHPKFMMRSFGAIPDDHLLAARLIDVTSSDVTTSTTLTL